MTSGQWIINKKQMTALKVTKLKIVRKGKHACSVPGSHLNLVVVTKLWCSMAVMAKKKKKKKVCTNLQRESSNVKSPRHFTKNGGWYELQTDCVAVQLFTFWLQMSPSANRDFTSYRRGIRVCTNRSFEHSFNRAYLTNSTQMSEAISISFLSQG